MESLFDRPYDGDGAERLSYQGNWRDIFQNWEALALSFPGYIESFIAKFVNASTADGYNPYRISRDGIDWEAPEPDNRWANIGYWGDHQIVYLLRLVELSRAYHPARLCSCAGPGVFVYADVPYRIRPYADMLRDPRETIDFDDDRAREVDRRVAAIGADGELPALDDGSIVRVNSCGEAVADGAGPDGQPGAGRRNLDEHPAPGMERREQRAGRLRALDGDALCYLRRYLHLLQDMLTGERGRALQPIERSGRPGERRRRGAPGAHPLFSTRPVDPAARKAFMDAWGRSTIDTGRGCTAGSARRRRRSTSVCWRRSCGWRCATSSRAITLARRERRTVRRVQPASLRPTTVTTSIRSTRCWRGRLPC